MISIKRLIESNTEENLQALLRAYRDALGAVGEAGMRTCPPAGAALRESLDNLQEHLAGELTPAVVESTGAGVREKIGVWGDSAAEHFNRQTGEVKEIMLVLARTAEALGRRDRQYGSQFREFTEQLRNVANLEDLNRMRASLLESAVALKGCVEKMALENQETVARLSQEVHKYEARLDAAERQASSDPLTGLENRRKVERSIERRLENGQTFTVILIDLNGFKQINDGYGHLAGDQVLKQFADELKSVFRVVDVVGRWGGDEFVVVLDATAAEAESYIERIRKWVFGNYSLGAKNGGRQVCVEGALGVAAGRPGDTLAALVGRADAAMYRDKHAAAAGARAKPDGPRGKPVAPD